MGDAEQWIGSTDGKCAVFVTGSPRPVILEHGAGLGFSWAKIDNTLFYSFYGSPNCTTDEYDAFLSGLEASIRSHPSRLANLIVAGDFNAHSSGWGSTTNDERGALLSDQAATLDLIVCNTGSTPTYRRVNSASVIDVTLARSVPNNHPLVNDWRVLEDT